MDIRIQTNQIDCFICAYEKLVEIFYKVVCPTLWNSPSEDWDEVIQLITNLSLSEDHKKVLMNSETVKWIWEDIELRDDLLNANYS